MADNDTTQPSKTTQPAKPAENTEQSGSAKIVSDPPVSPSRWCSSKYLEFSLPSTYSIACINGPG